MSKSDKREESFESSDSEEDTTTPQSKKGEKLLELGSVEKDIDSPNMKREINPISQLRVRAILLLYLY